MRVPALAGPLRRKIWPLPAGPDVPSTLLSAREV